MRRASGLGATRLLILPALFGCASTQGEEASACTRWCEAFRACRLQLATAALDRGDEGTAVCEELDPAALQASCEATCPTAGPRGSAPSDACWSCQAEALSQSCGRNPECQTACGGSITPPPYAEDTWSGLRCRGAQAAPNVDVCPTAGSALIQVRQPPSPSLEYVGAAVVEDRGPLRLRRPNGEVIELALSGLLVPTATVGQHVQANIKANCSFEGCAVTVVLSRSGGGWFYAAWQGGPDALPQLPGVTFSQPYARCASTRNDCSAALPMSLEVTTADGAVLLEADQTGNLGSLTAHHGGGRRLFETVCTDQVVETSVGAISRP